MGELVGEWDTGEYNSVQKTGGGSHPALSFCQFRRQLQRRGFAQATHIEKSGIRGKWLREGLRGGRCKIQSPGLYLEMSGKQDFHNKSKSTFAFWSHDKIHVMLSNVTLLQLQLVLIKFIRYIYTYRCPNGWLWVNCLLPDFQEGHKEMTLWHWIFYHWNFGNHILASPFVLSQDNLTLCTPLHMSQGKSFQKNGNYPSS